MSKTLYENRWAEKVERFNDKFPVGTLVVFTEQNGVKFKTEIRYPAVVLGNGRPVIWLKNIREYVRFDRVVIS